MLRDRLVQGQDVMYRERDVHSREIIMHRETVERQEQPEI
jgi:hypothetical protein